MIYRYHGTTESTLALPANAIRDAGHIRAQEFLDNLVQLIIKPAITHWAILSLSSAVHSNLG